MKEIMEPLDKVKVFIEWIADRIKRNKNAIIVINGATGSGKTYSALSMAIMVAKRMGTRFTAEGNIDFSFSDLVSKINRPENRPAGTPFIFEEVGAVGGGASSREWQSAQNKLFFSYMQTCRSLNQVIFFTCPNFGYLEKGARELVHSQINTLTINGYTKRAILQPFIIQTNNRSGKQYFKYLRFQYKKKKLKLKTIEVPYPKDDNNKNLVEEYEDMKAKFNEKIKTMITDSQKEIKERKERVEPDVIRLKHLIEKGLSASEIAAIMNLSTRTVFKYRSLLRIDELPFDMPKK